MKLSGATGVCNPSLTLRPSGCHERTVGAVFNRDPIRESRLKTAPTAVESFMARSVEAINMIVRHTYKHSARLWLTLFAP